MKQIKASEIKPGMTIRWTHNKVTYECPVMDRDGTDEDGGVLCHISTMHSEYVDAEAGEVTVLAEPQPEEPTEFGARVVVKGRKFLRSTEGKYDDQPWLEENESAWRDWDDLCEMGPVTVIPDQGWTVPADGPEVPDRIEEWPESDTALRPYKWRDEYGEIWRHGSNSHVEGWTSGYLFQNRPVYGPWDRVTDDTPEVPERIEEWPEDDSHLREQRWRDRLGRMWCHGFTGFDTGWTCGSLFRGRPACGPWDRVTDA